MSRLPATRSTQTTWILSALCTALFGGSAMAGESSTRTFGVPKVGVMACASRWLSTGIARTVAAIRDRLTTKPARGRLPVFTLSPRRQPLETAPPGRTPIRAPGGDRPRLASWGGSAASLDYQPMKLYRPVVFTVSWYPIPGYTILSYTPAGVLATCATQTPVRLIQTTPRVPGMAPV